MDLTPEKFEKAEFAERRRGYDIDQVESFLEETGTEFAQMLAKFRHTEQRAAAAESRAETAEAKLAELDKIVADANERVQRAERVARAAKDQAESARAAATSTTERDNSSEVEQVANALVIAQRTADQTISEAKAKAESILDEARGRAERQLAEATTESEALVGEAAARAEEEFSSRRAEVAAEVAELERRRGQLEGVILQLDGRLARYRDELTLTATELTALAEDSARLGVRESISIPPDEVLSVNDPADETTELTDIAESDPLDSEPVAAGARDEGAEPHQSAPGGSGAGSSESNVDAPTATDSDAGPTDSGDQEADGGDGEVDPSAYLDLTTPVAATTDASSKAETTINGDGEWAPGSWSDFEATLDDDARSVADDSALAHSVSSVASGSAGTGSSTRGQGRPRSAQVDDRPTEAVDQVAAPRDRFLEELDQAVNSDDDDEALSAFLEGSGDPKARRFGWRR